MAHPTVHHPAEEEEQVRHISSSRYYIVWIALLFLTALTVFTARGIHIPHPWSLLVALAIATAKGALVALFFMHLWDHGGANRLVLVTALVFVGLLMGLTVLDNATRFSLTNPPNERNQRHMPPGPDILSTMVEPRGGLAPEVPHVLPGEQGGGPRPGGQGGGAEGMAPAPAGQGGAGQGGGGGAPQGGPARPTGSD